jgi:hypothetical protein
MQALLPASSLSDRHRLVLAVHLCRLGFAAAASSRLKPVWEYIEQPDTRVDT